MTDSTILPSTIMGTIGALYAIFVIIMQPIAVDKNKFIADPVKIFNFNKKINFFKTLFEVLAFLVIVCEAYNGMIVYLFSDSIIDNFKTLFDPLYSYFHTLIGQFYLLISYCFF